MSEVYELTDDENLVVECAQETNHQIDRGDVVAYVRKSYDVDWSGAKAGRLLRKLAKLGILARETQSSRGWGKGWDTVTYHLGRRF